MRLLESLKSSEVSSSPGTQDTVNNPREDDHMHFTLLHLALSTCIAKFMVSKSQRPLVPMSAEGYWMNK